MWLSLKVRGDKGKVDKVEVVGVKVNETKVIP